MLNSWTCSQPAPLLCPFHSVCRSEENVIHFPSEDQEGRKNPPGFSGEDCNSGVPVRYFQATRWSLYPFGTYVRPLNIFKKYRQPQMAALFQRKNPRPIDFGYGYHAQYNQSNLLLAVRGKAKSN